MTPLLLLACTGAAPSDSATSPDSAQAVLATVSLDFATGALASISLEDHGVSDLLAPTSGDAVVRALPARGETVVLNRYGYDNLRFYQTGAWAAPRLEVSVADGLGPTNPVDLAPCGEDLLVLLYERSEALFLSPETGAITGRLDLARWLDEDGQSPEAGSLAEWEGRLYLALQRMDRTDGWADRGGVVLEVDCGSRAVTAEWAAPGNARISAWPDGDGLLVQGREANGMAAGIYTFAPASGLRLAVGLSGETGEEVGDESVADLAARGDALLFTTLAADYSHYTLRCASLSGGETRELERFTEYLAELSNGPEGEAWLAAHWGWNGGETSRPGIHRFDLAGCARLDGGEPIRTSLAPASFAFP